MTHTVMERDGRGGVASSEGDVAMLEQGYWLLTLVGSSIALVAIVAHAIVQQNRPRPVPIRIRRDRDRR